MAAERRNWSRSEVEAVVADYFDMLELELRGLTYSKAEHRRRLREKLDRRTDGSVEYKHQNISAVLLNAELGCITGYKPAWNYQELLEAVVLERLEGATGLLTLMGQEVERPAEVPDVDDILARLVDVPRRERAPRYRPARDREKHRFQSPNYLRREALNASLGAAGEHFVLKFETARLLSEGQDRLASKVEQVSRTKGDAEGFDVLSFDADGRERLIEVKTTTFGQFTPFYVSQNQVRTSQARRDQYQVYRLFSFRRDPGLFCMPGAIDSSCELEPTEYVARLP